MRCITRWRNDICDSEFSGLIHGSVEMFVSSVNISFAVWVFSMYNDRKRKKSKKHKKKEKKERKTLSKL